METKGQGMQSTSPRWQSRISFIFAASAAAIGLGNIWRFPYLVGESGGSAFVLLYLLFVIILGYPLLICEMTLGRIGRHNPAKAMASVAEKSNRSRLWGLVGALTIISAFIILSYYVVIIGWVSDYFFRAIMGQFKNATVASSLSTFKNLQAKPWEMVWDTTLIILATGGVIIFGVKRGLEKAVMIMFPALLVLLFLLLGYAMTTPGFPKAIHFLFHPDFQKINAHVVLVALGQAFFSLNIAMAITMMFSAYLPVKTPLVSSAVAVAAADTLFALLAGMIIFPIVFSFNLQSDAGPSLIFQTLPVAFGKIDYGTVISSLFFLLLFFAAFTSAIALLEPTVVWLMEKFTIKRWLAVVLSMIGCWILSLGTIFSFSDWKSITLFGRTFYQFIDDLTAGLTLPIGGMMIAIFVGWFLQKSVLENELDWKLHRHWFPIWRFILRYIAPLAILLILLTSFHII